MNRLLTSANLSLTITVHAALATEPNKAGQTSAPVASISSSASLVAGDSRDRPFDKDWRFLRGDAPGAENPAFDDSSWRKLDVPHDWSIEDLPPKKHTVTKTDRVGPFDPSESENADKTGYMVGGIGWYRKHFTISESNKQIAVRFDGVYMNAEVWINGHLLGNHPHGYTGFEFDLTAYLKPHGQENVLTVCVRNEGKNSRWYSGSGIYRHVWLTVTEPIHVPTWGMFVTTPEVSKDKALVKVSVEVRNTTGSEKNTLIRARVRDARGKAIDSSEGSLHLPANETGSTEQFVEILSPMLWSPDSPNLYSTEVEVIIDGKTADTVSTPFGIRKIEVDAEHGFRLNGETLKLKGGCVHHDNGPLGAAAIDRAEERKVELLKANGFNAIRSSHNPPSPALLDACDRLGMLVVDEAFDQWNEAKLDNHQDYHLYFKDWYQRDIASMVRADRNHPSVVMWSIGNEIPEQFRAEETARHLREAVLVHDSTRPVTAAICTDYGEVIKHWDKLSDPAFPHLDVAGYNYLPEKYESDHARHPERVMYGSESFPKDFFRYWTLVEKHPYVIGDFVWTAMDYFGEAGIGHSTLSNEKDSFFMSWPWFNAWCGDLDVCGFKKPQSFYRDVVWRRSEIEMAVHAPMPMGVHEIVSNWGWPNESQSWNWPGQEGKPLQVAVYSRCEIVRLELNGKVIGEQPVSDETKLTARFDVPYSSGELRALGLINGKVVAQTTLKTSGAPKKLKLSADRTSILADRNDLSYVTVEVVDANGQRVPDAEIPVRFSVTGAGELAAQASGSPNDPASFRAPVRKTFQGRCLAILRPTGDAGDITLRAEAEGVEPETITVGSREGNMVSAPKPILDGYTADPAIRVFGDTYYIYPTSDKPHWLTTDFSVWSSKNLVEWKNEGMVLDVTKDLKWANIKAWAPDCIERNGTFYFYFCADGKIGVATADKPTGPFKDALGHPLIEKGGKVTTNTIDPCAFIDDDGQAYLYYGNGSAAQVFKLKPDMITLDGDPADISLKEFREGIWVFKRQGKYYFMWSIDDARSPDYRVGWGIADSPFGPVKTPEKDFIVLQKNGLAIGTAHHSVVNVPGTDRWYVAYHRHAIPGGSGYKRETCLVRMEFNADGTIKPMDPLTMPFQPGDAGEPIVDGKGRPD